MNDNGLISVESQFSVAETVDRLTKAVTAAGLRIFSRIDHAAGAADLDMPLRPTQLVIFGNPQGGTPLMQDKQTAGIDLPVKALVWEDEKGTVWLTYNDMAWVADRHGLGQASSLEVAAIAAGLAKLAEVASVG